MLRGKKHLTAVLLTVAKEAAASLQKLGLPFDSCNLGDIPEREEIRRISQHDLKNHCEQFVWETLAGKET